MNRQLLFKYEVYDSVVLEPGRTDYRLFEETSEQGESVTRMNEGQALEWLLTNKSFKEMFLNEFFPGISDVKVFTGLSAPFTSSNTIPGDIDLLLVSESRPDKTIAFECKRVKAVSGPGNIAKVNNVRKLVHGVKQANAYQSLGFHQSYLAVILLDDGRALNTPNTMFRYGKTASIESIYEIPWNEPLHPDVGIVFIKLNQTTGKNVEHAGGFGFCVDKVAGRLEQRDEMSQKVTALLRTCNKSI